MRARDPFPEMAHISSDFFFVSGECPPSPPFSAAAEYFLSRSPTLRAGDIRLPQLLSYRRGCAPMLGFLEGRGRAGTAEGSMGLDVYGWVALAPPSARSLVPCQMASPQRKFGVHGWVPAPWGFLLPRPPLHAAHRGLDGAARGRQCPAGAASHLLGSWMLLLQAPQGQAPTPRLQGTGCHEYLLSTSGHSSCNPD